MSKNLKNKIIDTMKNPSKFKSDFTPRMTIAQAAKFYRVSRPTMRQALRASKIEIGEDRKVTHTQAWAALAVHRLAVDARAPR
jgi:hypothetical protein